MKARKKGCTPDARDTSVTAPTSGSENTAHSAVPPASSAPALSAISHGDGGMSLSSPLVLVESASPGDDSMSVSESSVWGSP